jgi:hypothetical protein
MAPKNHAGRRGAADKREADYRHPEAKTPLRPAVRTQAQFRKRKSPAKYRYDSSLSPALDWDGQNPARELGESAIREILDLNSAAIDTATTADEAKEAARGNSFPASRNGDGTADRVIARGIRATGNGAEIAGNRAALAASGERAISGFCRAGPAKQMDVSNDQSRCCKARCGNSRFASDRRGKFGVHQRRVRKDARGDEGVVWPRWIG